MFWRLKIMRCFLLNESALISKESGQIAQLVNVLDNGMYIHCSSCTAHHCSAFYPPASSGHPCRSLGATHTCCGNPCDFFSRWHDLFNFLTRLKPSRTLRRVLQDHDRVELLSATILHRIGFRWGRSTFGFIDFYLATRR